MPWSLLRPEPQMLVKALIDSGANVNALGRHKKTSVQYAIERKNTTVIRQLPDAGASVSPSVMDRADEHIRQLIEGNR